MLLYFGPTLSRAIFWILITAYVDVLALKKLHYDIVRFGNLNDVKYFMTAHCIKYLHDANVSCGNV